MGLSVFSNRNKHETTLLSLLFKNSYFSIKFTSPQIDKEAPITHVAVTL